MPNTLKLAAIRIADRGAITIGRTVSSQVQYAFIRAAICTGDGVQRIQRRAILSRCWPCVSVVVGRRRSVEGWGAKLLAHGFAKGYKSVRGKKVQLQRYSDRNSLEEPLGWHLGDVRNHQRGGCSTADKTKVGEDNQLTKRMWASIDPGHIVNMQFCR
jgi:hypothetical protein